jgi:hypothetical protein
VLIFSADFIQSAVTPTLVHGRYATLQSDEKLQKIINGSFSTLEKLDYFKDSSILYVN